MDVIKGDFFWFAVFSLVTQLSTSCIQKRMVFVIISLHNSSNVNFVVYVVVKRPDVTLTIIYF